MKSSEVKNLISAEMKRAYQDAAKENAYANLDQFCLHISNAINQQGGDVADAKEMIRASFDSLNIIAKPSKTDIARMIYGNPFSGFKINHGAGYRFESDERYNRFFELFQMIDSNMRKAQIVDYIYEKW